MSDTKVTLTKDQVLEHVVGHLQSAKENLSMDDYSDLLESLRSEVDVYIDELETSDEDDPGIDN